MPLDEGDRTWRVTSEEELKYDVTMVSNYFLSGDPKLILGGREPGPRAVIIDAAVQKIYGPEIMRFLDKAGAKCTPLVIGPTEDTKTFQTVMQIFDYLLGQNLDRREQPVIAIGGGVLTDLAGQAASMLARGTPWVRVVTTGQMWDAGTSAKVGGNWKRKKSAFGSFHMPVHTIVDRSFLRTLPQRLMIDAFAEMVKVALIMNRRLFDLCKVHGARAIAERFRGSTPSGDATYAEMIRLTVQGSLSDNADNLRETNLYRRMHLGHTWVIEVLSRTMGRTPLHHGQAVSIDIALSAKLAVRYGLLTGEEAASVLRLLAGVGLPIAHELLADEEIMTEVHRGAIRSRAGKIRAPLPKGIGGHQFVDDIPPAHVIEAGRELIEEAAS